MNDKTLCGKVEINWSDLLEMLVVLWGAQEQMKKFHTPEYLKQVYENFDRVSKEAKINMDYSIILGNEK